MMKKIHFPARFAALVSGLALLGAFGLVTVGCGKSDTPAKSAADTKGDGQDKGQGQGGMTDLSAQGPGVNTSSLHVAEGIAKACNLPAPKEQANFAYDSANIAPDDKDLLNALAKCLSEGPLKGKKIALVGRADPRGEEEYNMSLGGKRAEAVRQYLKSLGVEENRVATTSRGKLDAEGKDEAGYAKDRRVDIQLAN